MGNMPQRSVHCVCAWLCLLGACTDNSLSSPPSARDGVQPETLLALTLKDGETEMGALSFRAATLHWEPDGTSLLIGVAAHGAEPAHILRMDAASGEATRLADGAAPALSHDGSVLASLQADGMIRLDKMSATSLQRLAVLSTRPEGVGRIVGPLATSYHWAPDAMSLVYTRLLTAEPGFGGAVWYPGRTEIRIYDVISGEDRRVYLSPEQVPSYLEDGQFPVGGIGYGPKRRVYFSVGTGVGKTGRDATLVYLDAKAEQPTVLAEDVANNALMVEPIISPDGRLIASYYSPDPDFLNYTIVSQKAFFDAETGARTVFSDAPLAVDRRLAWSPSSDIVFFVCKPGAIANTLCAGSAKTGDVMQTTLEAMAEIGNFAISPDGERIAWISRHRTDTIRVRVANLDGGNNKTLFEQSRVDISDAALGETRVVHWTSFDGLKFEGLLILPVGYREGSQVPLVVDIHGGPRGGVKLDGSLLNSSPLEHHLWAAKGYAVFLADYRKGQIAGQDWDLLVRPEGMSLHEADANDVIAGIERIIAMGVADTNRIAAIGHSYGATVLNQLLTQTDILAAAVSKEGTTDFRGMRALQGPANDPSQYETALFVLNARPETLTEWVERSSPIVYADRIKTPLLLITAGHGEEWIDRQREAATAFVGAINAAGGTAESLFFADDYHVILKEDNVREMLAKTIEWLDMYIGSGATASH